MTLDLPFGVWEQSFMCTVAVLLAAWLILGSRRVKSRRVRGALFVLRLLVLLILFAILAAPVGLEDTDAAPGRRTVCFLVDASGSMGVGRGRTRFEEARRLVTAAMEEGSDRQTEVAFFSDALRFPADEAEDPWLLPAGLGDNSSLARGLNELLVSGLEREMAEVVVLSDGRIDDRQDLGHAIALARRHGVPVSTILFPETGAPKNIAIANCFVPSHVPRGSRVRVRAMLRIVGLRDAVGDLVLRRAGGTIVQRRKIPLEPGLHEHELTLSAGREDESFSLEISPQEGELSVQDNQFAFDLSVREPLTRVLYMEGSNHKDETWGRWEYDYFREAFAETGHIQVDVLTVDKQVAAGGQLFRLDDRDRGYPESRDELLSYDVVICSDINRSVFTEDQLRWTVDLVTQRGGGFCMIGGYTAFGAGGWDRTIWEQMIPMDMQTLADGYVMEEFQPVIPDAAREHPVLQIDFEPDRNRRILDAHPPLMGTNLVNRAKPGATVLIVHPEREMPVVSVQSYGRGRAMAFTSDAAGGWGDRYQTEWGEGEMDNRYYRTFWANVATWLGENSLSRHRMALAGFTESTRYRTGEVIRLRAVLLRDVDVDELAELSVTACLALPNAVPQRLTLSRETRDFRGDIVIPKSVDAGTLEIVFAGDRGDDAAPLDARCAVEVTRVSKEFLDVSPDSALLEQLAASTGGKVLASREELRELLQVEEEATDHLQLSRVPLWDRPWIWGLLIALLAAEWITRKVIRFR